MEDFKNCLLSVFRNTNSGVPHFRAQDALLPVQIHHHTTLFGEFDGIGNQIDKYLAQPYFVKNHVLRQAIA